jgi:hypothetical protein
MFQLFLSHSSTDAGLALRIKQHIEETGRATVYLAELDVQPGVDLAAKVQAEIRKSDATIVLFTHHALASAYVNQEVGFALNGKVVIPIVEKGIDKGRLGMLQGREFIEMDPAAPDESLSRLNAYVLERARRKDQELVLLLGMVGLVVLLGLGSSEGGAGT